ncbi:hypothetical protein DFA_01664 [Cavenderia fasciculata]|uniref:THH1/TOM1/TOM3 domain-containing protein n=1 Tax=Cavenderia fasciculata TaxID=261658 RepID=F4PU10_CACFS|nr:uncharacterized protein DFA_01664 [Cavenderia fasciculata]EGG21778.1 hypothetical protein DFA_01664 [Cavenderia fasciculata]|eukprot:XP_004359628.1 hypothetical protein DFA_01664 [Cavenderia fasciculata]
MITPNSFTENDSLDKLVLAFLVFRIVVSAAISFSASVQTFYEIKYQHWRNVINPRFLVLLGISIFLALRIVYTGVFIETKDQGFTSSTVFVRMFVTFFTLQSWIFIGSFWMQLLFTLYIAKRVRMEVMLTFNYTKIQKRFKLIIYFI